MLTAASAARAGRDDGSVLLLVLLYTTVAAALIVIAIDASRLFLARRALTGVADAAALAGSQQVDRRVVYASGASGCELPVDPAGAAAAAAERVAEAAPGLLGTVTALADPVTSVRAGTVSVRLDAEVRLPFDRIVTLLRPDRSPTVHLSVVAKARSPLLGACP